MGAAAVAGVDVAGGGHVEGAVEVVARALAVELAGAEVDVGGAVAVHPGLGLEAVGASIAGVEGDRLEDGEHFCPQNGKNSVSCWLEQVRPCSTPTTKRAPHQHKSSVATERPLSANPAQLA